MRIWLVLIIVLCIGISSCTTEVQVSKVEPPTGAVILVIDGLGASYVYPEHRAYCLDGAATEKAILFNLTGDATRVPDLRVPVPSTTSSHSVLVTGNSGAGSELVSIPGATIFDVARDNGFLCIAILQRGDSIEMVLEQDGVLYLEDNSIWGAEPTIGAREDIDDEVLSLLKKWHSMFNFYTQEKGTAGYINYNLWGLDAAGDVVGHIGDRPFLLMVNVGAIDSAGHHLDPERYLEAIAALDQPLGRLVETCQSNGVLLFITADHGMSFPSADARGGHASDKYAKRLESIRVPLTLYGPGLDDVIVGGIWSQTDIVPTIIDTLDLSGSPSLSEGRCIPLLKFYDLEVKTKSPGEVRIKKENDLVAVATGDATYIFKGLKRGAYSVLVDGRTYPVCMNGDQVLDMTRAPPSDSDRKKIIGVALIILINLVGVILIIWIIKKG
jgi:2,3-bisphosphoglycerate-independent phosphoglycerate mutase